MAHIAPLKHNNSPKFDLLGPGHLRNNRTLTNASHRQAAQKRTKCNSSKKKKKKRLFRNIPGKLNSWNCHHAAIKGNNVNWPPYVYWQSERLEFYLELLTGSCSSLKSHQIFSRNPRGDSRLEEVRFHFPVINPKVRLGPFSLSTHLFSHLRSWAAATAGARIFSMAQLLLFLLFF